MNAVLKKELAGFLFSPISYIAATLYTVSCGLFVWVFKETSVLYRGYADPDIFFRVVPFIYIFLVPAVTMRFFAEERKTGTIDFLLSKPIRIGHIIFGKFTASLLFIISINFFLTLYIFSVYKLGNPTGNIDMAAVAGACIGLGLTSALFTAVGLFSSALAKNQISAFLIGVFLCFLLQFGLPSLTRLSEGTAGKIALEWSIPEHYESMKKGVLIVGDVLFFIVVTVLFLLMGTLRVSGLRGKISVTKKTVYFSVISMICLWITLPAFGLKIPWINYRIDLTGDKRFSLSNSAKNFLKTLDKQAYAEVYLTGKLPPAFERLEERVRETLQNLDDALPAGIRYKFIDPTAAEIEREKLYASLTERGIIPLNVVDEEGDQSIRKIVFPYLTLRYDNQEIVVPLLQGNRSAGAENMLNQSAEALEYELVSALKKIGRHKKKKVAFLRGHGEAEGASVWSFEQLLRESYEVRNIALDTIESLSEYDAVIILDPQTGFSENDLYVTDRYVTEGGSVLFFIDPVRADIDSIGEKGYTALPRSLGLDDLFFRYGFKLPPVLLRDLYCTEIPLYVGQAGTTPQIVPLPWPYWPVINRFGNHPTVKNMGPISLKFSGIIDTAVRTSGIVKTPLLFSSDYSKIDDTPIALHFDDLKRGVDPKEYSAPSQTVALLAEGTFKSLFTDRFMSTPSSAASSKPGKVFVCADADVALNETHLKTGTPLPLGTDRYNSVPLANTYFLTNILDYMTAPETFVELKSREIVLRLLDKRKIKEQKTFIWTINIGLPVLCILILGILVPIVRKKRYTKLRANAARLPFYS